jgi:hypothetical protein
MADLSIDVTKDLESFSALNTMLSSQGGAIFSVLEGLEQYATLPLKQAAAAKASAKLALSGSATWTTTNGIGFSLTPSASCSISIGDTSETFPIAMNVDSTQTTNVGAGPTVGTAYVNIDLDFSIQGTVSGSGAFSGVGIAGEASGSKAATLSFCQPLDDSMPTLTAIKSAFSHVVFPLDPTCTKNMQIGTIAKVSFDGAFDCEIDVTYGLGDYKVSAPSLATVQQSLQNVVNITPPSVEINAGVTGSVTYTHADHFTLIVEKTDDATALLYLVRSSENDVGGSLGITVGVTTTNASVSVDQSALQAAVGNVTGTAIASQVASAAAQPLNNLQTSLNGRLTSFISDLSGQAGLLFSLSRQKGRVALFVFRVNLGAADLAAASWSALVGGSVIKALALNGFILQAGSGVADSLKRVSTIQLQFFNLFSFTSATDYFSNAYTELGSDGAIRVFRDLGQEQQNNTKRALAKFRIHFVATATESALSNISQATVDMYVELSESGDSAAGVTLANVVGLIPANASVHAVQTAMATYLANHPLGSLSLILIIKRSAYQKLSCTAYNGNTPLPLPHEQDQNNWVAFQSATEALVPDLAFVNNLTFLSWMTFNRDSIDEVGSTIVPDRRQIGDPAVVPSSFYNQIGPPALVSYFLQASAGFMNLCEDLKILAAATSADQDTDQWNNLLNFLTNIVTKDVFIDYANPTAGALLYQCSIGGAQVTAVADLPQDASSLTCTLTLA